MNKALVASGKPKKFIVSVLFALYLLQLVANVGLASQYSFYQYASQGVAAGLYVSIIFTPLVFLIAYAMLRRYVAPRLEVLYQSALWALVGLFLFSFIVVLLRYLIEPYIDMGAWREAVSPSITIATLLCLLAYYVRGNHTQTLLHKIALSTALLYLATLASRPFLAALRALTYSDTGGSDIMFDMIFGTFPMFYYHFAPLIFIVILALAGFAFTGASSLRRRFFDTIVSSALALLVAETIQQLGNFFISYLNDSPFYIAVHVASYAVATGVFLYLVSLLQKHRD